MKTNSLFACSISLLFLIDLSNKKKKKNSILYVNFSHFNRMYMISNTEKKQERIKGIRMRLARDIQPTGLYTKKSGSSIS